MVTPPATTGNTMGYSNAWNRPGKWSRSRNMGSLEHPASKLLRPNGFGCEFISHLSKVTIQFVGYAFVDDTDLIEPKSHKTEGREAWHSLQQAVDTWEGGLKATCGALVPGKNILVFN